MNHENLPPPRLSSRILFGLTLALALLAALGHPGTAEAQTQTRPALLQAANSEIAFTTRQMGVPVDGRFTRFTAQVALDPKKPETGQVAFTIDTGSARFGSAELDAEVPKPTWLNVPAFPQATFRSTGIRAAGPGRFDISGQLAIKGATRALVVPVQVTQTGSGAALTSTATGSFTLKRLDFKIGEAEWADTSMLGNDIAVKFKLVLTGLAPL
jgi:polyisoprenoid-binding protein YceI